MNLFLVLFWICMFLFVIYFFNTLLVYIEILACMNSYITWLVSISFPPIIVHILWNIFGSITHFDNFSFIFIHQDLKFLKN